MFGGPGTGAECSLCGGRIASHQAEVELEFSGAQAWESSRFTAHTQCFRTWESEVLGTGAPLPTAGDVGKLASRVGPSRQQTSE